ncbi:uroporphyrinogen-III C-methyltransferase [uncultured Gilliamella sp.]|uniref:uroporphyrinogen-III C-methyltransferase n=1 Tax=uncultured Gilliamella sp. TaxID=1193505 RepID=UPI0025DB6A20|nr:uroporphyrinogen-III C-methyltransferase [uncultured Gilliamella sp.]
MPSKYYGANATLSTINTASFSQNSTINSQNETNKTMKEEKINSNESKSSPEVEIKDTSPTIKPNSNKAPVSKLSIVAIVLAIGLSGSIFYYGHKQIEKQKKVISTLQTQLANLKQTTKQSITNDLQNNITEAVNQQNQQFSSLEQRVNRQLSEQQKVQQQLANQINDATTLNEKNIHNLNERLSAMSSTDNNVWLISQANYLVHLAGRKIWNDQDYVSARLLLKSADESLAQTNDPSLLPTRQAINKDISSLSQISYIDTDGIIIKLIGLSDALTELPLVGNYKNLDLGMTQYTEVPPETTTLNNNGSEVKPIPNNNENSDNNNISTSIADWSSNLLNNTSTFMQKFITIEKLDETENNFATCLSKAGNDEKQIVQCQILKTPLSLEQSLYLRENIRFRLLIAAQAVPRHQELIYQRALSDASIWVNAYFDGDAPSVKAFLDDLENLRSQPISDQYIPEKLVSASELEKLMQTRVRSMLAK